MSRIKRINLDGFRAYRSTKNGPHCINTDADIVLITGKNGSGKTSLMQAVTLLLNGYDRQILDGVELLNVHSKTKEATLTIDGMSGFRNQPAKSKKDWMAWKSPFECNRNSLTPALARAASAYFQDQVSELANGDFLEHLTGVGNQGQQVSAWIKECHKAWKIRADSSLPSEKDWNIERKNIFQSIKSIEEHLPEGSLQRDYFKGFNPIIASGGLSKRWMMQVVNFAQKFGVERDRYDTELLRQLRLQLQEPMKSDLSQKNKAKTDQTSRQLNRLLAAYGETLDIVPQLEWDKLDTIKAELENSLSTLLDSQASIKSCEPQSGALTSILSVLSTEAFNAYEESERLERNVIRIPGELRALFEDLNQYDYSALSSSYNRWRDEISKHLAEVAGKIKETSQKLHRHESHRQILSLLLDNPATKPFLESKATIAVHELLERIEIQSGRGEFSEREKSMALMSKLERAVNELHSLEQEHEIQVQEKIRRKSFTDAKEFAFQWESAFAKENSADGVLKAALNELDIESVIHALRSILSIFHLPPELTQSIQLSRKGSGQNAKLVPALGGIQFESLSTGQKTIFALAWTTVLNLAFRDHLGHKVMLFDDITTSLDLNQITPACVLFRKLAYAKKVSDRRQLLISSHHEDLTNRLIDNLIPPDGCSMKILEISDYTIDKGPIVEDSWNVAAANSCDS